MIPPEVFYFLAFATLIIGLALAYEDADHHDARRRNPESRTWDDEA
jgi:hypothetical protein